MKWMIAFSLPFLGCKDPMPSRPLPYGGGGGGDGIVVGTDDGDSGVEDTNPQPDVLDYDDQDAADGITAVMEGDCGFTWPEQFGVNPEDFSSVREIRGPTLPYLGDVVDQIVYPEPSPSGTWSLHRDSEGLTMPDYTDDMPLFERSVAWDESTRCFETPLGSMELTEDDAYWLYRDIVEQTTGERVDDSEGLRSIVGLRGAWPGTFFWHGNTPDQFNDTLVVIWMEGGEGRVREFPINTDTGAKYFGYNSSSSLRPNRRYAYTNDWHRSYNAMRIDEYGYRVQDDSNGNGHWDSDRNGWLSGGNADNERAGSGHNIHMGSVDGPLGSALVQSWSAGCQVIPGIDNWTQFLDVSWEEEGADVSYFLIDVRDIAPQVWTDCSPDGSHACPFAIEETGFVDTRNTLDASDREFDVYNCDDADESGPEFVYVFTTSETVDVDISVECEDGVDVDIHLLEGDDPDACLARAHTDLSREVSPGRYLVVVDTWADDGEVFAGEYTLHFDMD